MIEIERKFLVKSSDYKKEAIKSFNIIQAFLNRDENRTIRIRIQDSKGFLTIKGKSSEDGLSRFEWEQEIDRDDALNLLKLCEAGRIEKTRYLVELNNHVFEIDEFHGENDGLVIAEIELNEASEHFEKPKWLGEEVTGNPKYYNSELSKTPYKTWEQ